MEQTDKPGQIIILNGAPRSGKSSIVTEIQAKFDGLWMNLGVDRFMQCTPARYLPGIGLRPGGERPDIEPFIPILYRPARWVARLTDCDNRAIVSSTNLISNFNCNVSGSPKDVRIFLVDGVGRAK